MLLNKLILDVRARGHRRSMLRILAPMRSRGLLFVEREHDDMVGLKLTACSKTGRFTRLRPQ